MNRQQLKRLALALGLGIAGGLTFQMLQLPLAWMLGPMLFNAAAALSRWPVAVPNSLRTPMQMLVGVYLGSSFSPDTLARAGEWPWSMAALALFTVLSTVVTMIYYWRCAGFDRTTALFSATPGALSMVVILGGSLGGDERRIALAQSLRIAVVVLLVPMLVLAFNHQPPAAVPISAVAEGNWLWDIGLLAVAVTLAFWVLRRLHLPGAEIIGPLLASAALYMFDWVHLALPRSLLNTTLLVIGASVGARFTGVTLRELLDIGKHALIAIALSLLLAALFAEGISLGLDVSFLAALLALAPGGVAEMCVIATVFHIDPVFVAAHHLARLLLLVVLMPLLVRVSRGWS